MGKRQANAADGLDLDQIVTGGSTRSRKPAGEWWRTGGTDSDAPQPIKRQKSKTPVVEAIAEQPFEPFEPPADDDVGQQEMAIEDQQQQHNGQDIQQQQPAVDAALEPTAPPASAHAPEEITVEPHADGQQTISPDEEHDAPAAEQAHNKQQQIHEPPPAEQPSRAAAEPQQLAQQEAVHAVAPPLSRTETQPVAKEQPKNAWMIPKREVQLMPHAERQQNLPVPKTNEVPFTYINAAMTEVDNSREREQGRGRRKDRNPRNAKGQPLGVKFVDGEDFKGHRRAPLVVVGSQPTKEELTQQHQEAVDEEERNARLTEEKDRQEERYRKLIDEMELGTRQKRALKSFFAIDWETIPTPLLAANANQECTSLLDRINAMLQLDSAYEITPLPLAVVEQP